MDREMYLFMITAENTMRYKYNFFILQDAIHSTVTLQNKGMTHRTIYCTVHKDDANYTMLNAQSGLVHLSCPPECRWLWVLLTGELPVRKLLWFVTCYYTWAAAGLSGVVKYFLGTVISSTFCKVRPKALGTAAVLEGQDSKTCTEW
jgi:hypothetical protein